MLTMAMPQVADHVGLRYREDSTTGVRQAVPGNGAVSQSRESTLSTSTDDQQIVWFLSHTDEGPSGGAANQH
jgi:hypothetical protein